MRRQIVVAIGLLIGTVAAAPSQEVVRDEAYNFRVIGRLPPGWKRSNDRLVWAYAIEGIPHAYVHLVRERLSGTVDVEAQVRARAEHYAFPGAPKDAAGTVKVATWNGYRGARFELTTTVKDVVCRRRVTAICVKSIWYELVETSYGAETEKDYRCTEGFDVFRNGFKTLTRPVPKAALADLAPAEIEDRQFGFTLAKPKGFARIEVDTRLDPGCRVFLRAQRTPQTQARVRVFEYGRRPVLDTKQWFDIYWGSFTGLHTDTERTALEPISIPGAKAVEGERFTGIRDKRPVTTLIYLIHATDGRVLALRLQRTGDSEKEFGPLLRSVLESFRVTS